MKIITIKRNDFQIGHSNLKFDAHKGRYDQYGKEFRILTILICDLLEFSISRKQSHFSSHREQNHYLKLVTQITGSRRKLACNKN